jgi:hypothetical protein
LRLPAQGARTAGKHTAYGGQRHSGFTRWQTQGGLDQVASAGKKVGTQVKDFANQKKENVAEAIDAGKEAYRVSGTEG